MQLGLPQPQADENLRVDTENSDRASMVNIKVLQQ